MVFDAMNQVVGAAVDLIDKPEFIIAVGDNIYPAVANAPTSAEFQDMLSLFNRTNIADLSVFASEATTTPTLTGLKNSSFQWNRPSGNYLPSITLRWFQLEPTAR